MKLRWSRFFMELDFNFLTIAVQPNSIPMRYGIRKITNVYFAHCENRWTNFFFVWFCIQGPTLNRFDKLIWHSHSDFAICYNHFRYVHTMLSDLSWLTFVLIWNTKRFWLQVGNLSNSKEQKFGKTLPLDTNFANINKPIRNHK